MDVERLNELHGKVSNCRQCTLAPNGHKPPMWYHNSQYVMFMESPLSIQQNVMDKFWEIAEEYNLKREQFMLIHAVQCLTQDSYRKSRERPTMPSKFHRAECFPWRYEYISALQPKKMIAFGNVCLEELTGQYSGITEKNATVIAPKYSGWLVPTVLSISPAALPYRKDAETMIRASLKKFKEM